MLFAVLDLSALLLLLAVQVFFSSSSGLLLWLTSLAAAATEVPSSDFFLNAEADETSLTSPTSALGEDILIL